MLYVTLSETGDERRTVAGSHGWSLDGATVEELTPSEEALRPDAQYTILHASEVELDETVGAVLEVVERVRPSRVVVDSLSELRLMRSDPLRYRREILGLKQFFVGRRCTVLLLDDVHRASEGIQIGRRAWRAGRRIPLRRKRRHVPGAVPGSRARPRSARCVRARHLPTTGDGPALPR